MSRPNLRAPAAAAHAPDAPRAFPAAAFLTLLAASAMLAGCGIKGPLKLPPPAPAAAAPAPAAASAASPATATPSTTDTPASGKQ